MYPGGEMKLIANFLEILMNLFIEMKTTSGKL